MDTKLNTLELIKEVNNKIANEIEEHSKYYQVHIDMFKTQIKTLEDLLINNEYDESQRHVIENMIIYLKNKLQRYREFLSLVQYHSVNQA